MSPALTYLVTGANRGLGAGLVRQILQHSPNARVVAAVRAPADAGELCALAAASGGRVGVVGLDLLDLAGIRAAAKEVEGMEVARDGIDVLINSAGAMHGGPFQDALDPEALTTLDANHRTNTLGPLAVTQAFLPLLRKGQAKAVWFVSSNAGRFSSQTSKLAMTATYSASKAASNLLTLKLAHALREEAFTVLAVHPGWISSDMGGPHADLTPDESAAHILSSLSAKTTADSGQMFNHDGAPLAW